jgi:HD-like signal output (HDOD) protein
VLGCALAKLWRFPYFICQSIRHQDAPPKSAPILTRIVAAAHELAGAFPGKRRTPSASSSLPRASGNHSSHAGII